MSFQGAFSAAERTLAAGQLDSHLALLQPRILALVHALGEGTALVMPVFPPAMLEGEAELLEARELRLRCQTAAPRFAAPPLAGAAQAKCNLSAEHT